jgi:integrase
MASIAKRKNGKWLARYRDATGKEHAKQFVRKADGDKWLASLTTALARGEWVDPSLSKITVEAWSAYWLKGQAHLKPSTRATYESLLRHHVIPAWGNVRLNAVSHADVAAWVARLHADGLSASRTRQAHRVLSLMLTLAVRDGRLARNTAEGVDLPRLPHDQRRYLDHIQVARLAGAAGPYRTLVLTLAYCGLRFGEAAALRVCNVDLMRCRLRIVESVTEVNGRLEFGATKTHAARSVPLPPSLRDALMVQLAGKAPGDFVFTSPEGGTLRVTAFRQRQFDKAVREAGLDGLTPHELRHTAASLAIAAGANVKAVQAMLGHTSATTTLDRYGHLFADDLDAVAQRLDVAAADAFADQVRTSSGSQVISLPLVANENAF